MVRPTDLKSAGAGVTGENWFFCSVERKEFQRAHAWRSLNVMARFYLGLRELMHPQRHREQAGSRSNCHKAPVNLPYIFLVHGKEQGAIQTIQPNFLILRGFDQTLLPTNSFPGRTGVRRLLSNSITFPVFPRLGSAPPCHQPGSHCLCLKGNTSPCAILILKSCDVIWF